MGPGLLQEQLLIWRLLMCAKPIVDTRAQQSERRHSPIRQSRLPAAWQHWPPKAISMIL